MDGGQEEDENVEKIRKLSTVAKHPRPSIGQSANGHREAIK